MKKKETVAEFSLILVALIWGCGFIATEYVIKANWSTSLIMAARFIIAAIAMTIALNKKILKLTKYELLHGSIAGVFLFLAFYTQTLGQSATTVSNTAFFTATNVVMVPFISWAINRNRPNMQTILLTLVALAGVGALNFKESGFLLGRGDLIVLLCAFFFAMQITYLEKATKGSDPARVNFVQIFLAAVISVVVFIINGEGLQSANIPQGLLPVIFLGILSTCLCYFLQTSAQKYSTASKVGVILSLEGFFGGLFSVLLGLEPLTINLVIGGTLIVGATILMSIDFKSSILNHRGRRLKKLMYQKKAYKYKGIIFDLDGVICHTDQYHYKAWKIIANELGIFFDQNVNNKLRGVSRMESLDIILNEGNVNLEVEEKEALATRKNEAYRTYLNEMTGADLDANVLETLKKLKELKIKMAIGSSSKNATFILGKLGLSDFFDAVIDGNCISESKPNPEVFDKARMAIHLKKEECVVVEDAFSGIEAANNAGIDSIGIGDASKSMKATYKISEFSDLLGNEFLGMISI